MTICYGGVRGGEEGEREQRIREKTADGGKGLFRVHVIIAENENIVVKIFYDRCFERWREPTVQEGEWSGVEWSGVERRGGEREKGGELDWS